MHLFSFPHYILDYIVLYFSEMGTIFALKWVPFFLRMGTHFFADNMVLYF